MGRLVARALRLKRSSLMQTGTTFTRYCLSHLTPALLADTPVLIVAPESEVNLLLEVEIPHLQAWLQTQRDILKSDRFPANFTGLLLTTPQQWLEDKLGKSRPFSPEYPHDNRSSRRFRHLSSRLSHRHHYPRTMVYFRVSISPA
jgi:ATP-dependent DNA helicase DinG